MDINDHIASKIMAMCVKHKLDVYLDEHFSDLSIKWITLRQDHQEYFDIFKISKTDITAYLNIIVYEVFQKGDPELFTKIENAVHMMIMTYDLKGTI